MKKLVFCIAIMATVCLTSCANKVKTDASDTADSTVAVSKADSANVGGGSAEEMGENETVEGGDPTDVEEWDVSVRTFDLDSQDPGPGYEVIIRNGEGKTLTFGERRGYGYPQDMLETFGNVWQTDVNFDGHTDVMICLGREPVSDQTFVRYDAWVYDTDDSKFYCQGTFRDICNPEVDREGRRILGHYIARDGETRVYSAYYWQKDGNITQEGETWTVKR